MTDHNISQTHCCQHYPNRVLQKKDLAVELGVCQKTVSNLMKSGSLPEPCWLNSIPVWMLYDIHAFLSAAAATSRNGGTPAQTADASTGTKSKKVANDRSHKAGKYRA